MSAVEYRNSQSCSLQEITMLTLIIPQWRLRGLEGGPLGTDVLLNLHTLFSQRLCSVSTYETYMYM